MNAVTTTDYGAYVAQLQDCLNSCESCLRVASPDEVCHHTMQQTTASLRTAIRMMQQDHRLTSRYLVDCSEMLELCVDRCEDAEHPSVQQALEVCRACVGVCRQASFLGI